MAVLRSTGLSAAGSGGTVAASGILNVNLVGTVTAPAGIDTVAVPIPSDFVRKPPSGPIVRVLGSVLPEPLHPAIDAIASTAAAPINELRSINLSSNVIAAGHYGLRLASAVFAAGPYYSS
jgi:hypothetical protein